jgi:branched-chain amino acid transport system permease protein
VSDGLEVCALAKNFGGVRVFEGLTLQAPRGQVTACIGPNGDGKTTLINIICGLIRADRGRVLLDGADMSGIRPHQTVKRGIGRTFQDVRIIPLLSALENVLVAFPDQRGESLRHIFLPGRRVSAEERWNRERATTLLDAVGLVSVADRPAGELPFGQQKLISLVRLIATGVSVLLLDEPATGVEREFQPYIIRAIQRLVRDEGKAVLVVEHNMDVVREVADHVVVLHGTVIASGPADTVVKDERVIREYLGRLYNA